MRGFAYVTGIALGGLELAACGSVPAPPSGDVATDGKTGEVDNRPLDGAPPMLCVAPSNPPMTKFHVNLFAEASGHSGPDSSCQKLGSSFTSSNPQYVFCRRWGGEVRDNAGNFNHWWLWTDLDNPPLTPAWISAYYISGQGNDEANDIYSGNPIPDCP